MFEEHFSIPHAVVGTVPKYTPTDGDAVGFLLAPVPAECLPVVYPIDAVTSPVAVIQIIQFTALIFIDNGLGIETPASFKQNIMNYKYSYLNCTAK